MSGTDNWGERLKERINSYIDWLYTFLTKEDSGEFEYVSRADSQEEKDKEMEIELHLSVKIKPR